MKIKYIQHSPFSPHFTFHTFCEDTEYRQTQASYGQQSVFEAKDDLN